MKNTKTHTFKLSKITIAVLEEKMTEYLKGGTDQTSILDKFSVLGSQCGNLMCL